MANPGIAPLDPDSVVGQLRSLVGDTEYRQLEPPVSGQGDYNVWPDLALQAALALTPDSPLRAAGYLYLQLAAQYAQSGKSIKTDDLAINTLGRGDSLAKVAQSFLDEAASSENAAANDSFQIIPFGGRARRTCSCRPEATPRPLTCAHAC